MNFWMLPRQILRNDLLDIFSALGDLQDQYDWCITDHDLWYAENCPDEVRRRWQWTGLLLDGKKLTEHLSARYVYFVSGGILSAVPKGTQPCRLWDYMPHWEIENFGASDYTFQTPLTQLELVCYDGYAWVIICKPEFSRRIRQHLPAAQTPAEFFRDFLKSGESSTAMCE